MTEEKSYLCMVSRYTFMSSPDVRWKQRFSSYQKALLRLEEAVQLAQTRPLTDLEEQGLVQAFEFTHELAWNVLKDYLSYQGFTEIRGSRDAFREAFRQGLIQNGEEWMETIRSRQQTVHSYNETTVSEIIIKIKEEYLLLFQELRFTLKEL